jgi:hypothetical protein
MMSLMQDRVSFTRYSLILLAAICALAQTPPSVLAVTGDVTSPLQLTAEDLARLPRVTASVQEQDGTRIQYEGVALRDVLAKAGAPLGKELRGKALASYILAKARDGYEVVFTLGEIDAGFGNQTILIADKRDGKPLFGYQGPFRLSAPTTRQARAPCGCSKAWNWCV